MLFSPNLIELGSFSEEKQKQKQPRDRFLRMFQGQRILKAGHVVLSHICACSEGFSEVLPLTSGHR